MSSIRLAQQFAIGHIELKVELNLPQNEIIAIYGPSGSGKSTLLKCIAGLEKAAGYCYIQQQCWQNDETAFFLPSHQRSIGYVFQKARLFDHLNVKDNLTFGYRRIPQKQRKIHPDDIIDLFGIQSLLKRKPNQLSGGEQQRVAIGRALLTSPELLLMDEPMNGLDRSRKQKILSYIQKLHQTWNIPIIYVSHSMEEVAHIADYLVLIEKGQVISQGAVINELARLDLPLSRQPDTGAIVEATLATHDTPYQLSYLDFPGGRITVPQQDLRLNQQYRIMIHARDVSITLNKPSQTSILNIFEVTVIEIVDEGNAKCMVKLDARGTVLLARITHKSKQRLQLETGLSVFAQVKSVALIG